MVVASLCAWTNVQTLSNPQLLFIFLLRRRRRANEDVIGVGPKTYLKRSTTPKIIYVLIKPSFPLTNARLKFLKV